MFINPSSSEVFLLETGWGLLFLVLVAVPFVGLAVRPRSPLLVVQVLAVAAAVAVTAVVTPAWPQLLPAVGLAITAVGVGLLAKHGVGEWRVRSVDRVLAALAALAVVPALLYAGQMVRAARAGVADDITWGLPHLPMQAAFAVALVVSALVAAAGGGSPQSGRRVVAWSVSISAVWLGAVSVTYPEHLASLGSVMGAAWIVWGVVFAIAAEMRRRG